MGNTFAAELVSMQTEELKIDSSELNFSTLSNEQLSRIQEIIAELHKLGHYASAQKLNEMTLAELEDELVWYKDELEKSTEEA